MNPQELELHKKLQSFYRKAMGPVRGTDLIYCEEKQNTFL